MNVFSRLFLFAIVMFCANNLLAQSAADLKKMQEMQMSTSDLSNFSADKLSDAEIRKYMEQAESSGYTEEQIEIGLLSRGIPQAEVDKLKIRMAKLNSGRAIGGNTSLDRTRVSSTQSEGASTLAGISLNKLGSNADLEKQMRVFGYKLFNSEVLTFETNLNVPTPKDYTLGPEDEIIIDIWGASEMTYQEIISPDGNIYIPNLGPIYLNGLSIERATERIIERLSKIYSGLKPYNEQSANTYAQVSLGQLRTIKIHVIGEAMRPGSYSISSLATVAHALYLSGGPSFAGSMRDIEIIRNNEIFTSIDVYGFLINGSLKNNVTLQDGDILRIKPYINRVEILGEVKREGIYETKEGESFEKLLSYAGGFTENAYTEILKVRRNFGGEKQFIDLKKENFATTPTANGDEVTVQGILQRYTNRVQIKGAVFREGEFQLVDGLTVKSLIELAEGLRGDAFMERGQIYRTNKDFSYSIISFNLRNILKGTEDDVLLQREDLVEISSIYDLNDERYVLINGEIKKSGTYPYFENMTVEDLIIRAGGLRASASGSMVEVARRVQNSDEKQTNQTAEIFNFSIDKSLELNEFDSKFSLQPYDQVFIRRSPGYEPQLIIKIEGEVIYPGLYSLKKKNERISDIIQRAGGLTSDGYPEGATLIRRSEFNPPKTNEQLRLENLSALLKSVEKKKSENNYIVESEAEILQQKRLQNVEDELTEYNANEDAGIGREGIRMKKERLNDLAKRDSIRMNSSSMQYETIGINLEEILKKPGSKYDLILQEGDILSIPRQLQTVRMRGEFLYPVTVRYDEGLNFRKYISKAGGFSEDARRKKSYVLYANGSVDRTKSFLFWKNYPQIDAGAEVIVPKKPEKKPLSAQAWIALSTSVATLALVVQQLVN